MTIVFHIGLERTGSSSFQRFCSDNTALLRRHSVLYPKGNLAFRGHNHAGLAACYLPYRDFDLDPRPAARPEVVGSLRREIDRAKAATVLISAEHLSSRFREAEIAALKSDFQDYRCRIAVVVRDHLSRLYSAYGSAILSGRHETLDEFCALQVDNPQNRYSRYRETLAPWDAVFGRENTIVVAYEPGRDIVEALCRAAISPDLTLPKTEVYAQNPSPGAGTIEAIRLVNAAVARPGHVSRGDYPRWALSRMLRKDVRRSIERDAQGHAQGPARLDPDLAKRLGEIAATDRAWLQSRYSVRLPAPPELPDTGQTPDAEAAALLARTLARRSLAGRILRLLDRWR